MTHTVHLQFEDMDNTVLQRLTGPLDAHLATLGKALDIQISRRFERFYLYRKLCPRAGRRALVELAGLAEGRDLNDDDIQLAAVAAKTVDAEHTEQRQDKQYYLQTKRGSIGGRTPAPKTATSAPC